MRKVRIKSNGIDSRDASIVIVNDDGSEVPIPNVKSLSISMEVGKPNTVDLNLIFVDVDVVATSDGIELEGSN